MSDQDLRKNLIRLAHANPELRPKILPLLKKAGESTATRADAKRLSDSTKNLVDELANLLIYDPKALRHADRAASALVAAHQALILLGRNLPIRPGQALRS